MTIYQEEMQRKAQHYGCITSYDEVDQLLLISHKGVHLTAINPEGFMFYNSKDLTDPESREVFSHLTDDAETVREYVGLYQSAPQMKPKDVQNYGKLTISNAELDSTYKTEGSTWDDYALIFKYHENGANEVVFNNVTFDRQVAIEKGVKATFNNCTINQTAATGDMYALWICAGADVTLNGCIINSINPNTGSNNRAIKIADQYITTPTLTKLSVAGTTFKSQKKAAVLVTSTAGANIVWGAGNDISAVVADQTNAVWNDADRTAAWELVTVSGCTKKQEQ